MKLGGPGLVLFLLHLVSIHTTNAMILVPPSITTCPGQTVMFNCTSYGIPIRWSVFTPDINYTNLEITHNQGHSESMDGVIMADLISLDNPNMPMIVVSSLTVNVTVGSKVQCLGITAADRSVETKSGFIHMAVPPGSIELRAPDVSDVEFGRTTITSITISWTPLELEGVYYNTSITPTIPFQTASTTSIVISNVPYNTQYNITLVASNCAGSSMDTISINYSECGPPVAGDGVVIHNYTTTFEGSSITFTCEDGLSPNDTITANCTGEGHWTIDPATYMCTTTSTTTSTTTPGITTTSTTTVIDNTNINMTTGSYSDCVVTAVISGVLFFIVGFAGGVLVVYYYGKWQSKHHPPPSQPAPLYEDIVTSTDKGEVELQLKDNVAYGQVR